jgi:hypothetical protein
VQPTSSQILNRYISYLRSPEFMPALKRLAPPPWWTYIVALLTFMTIGLPITLYQIFRIVTHRRRCRREMIEVAERSVPVMTYPLMVNHSLREQPGSIAPGSVIGSFDPKANETVEFLATLAERIALIGPGDATTPDEQVAERMMADEVYVPFRRRRLPLGMTGGREVYAFDLMILGDYFPSGTVEVPMIPCVSRANRAELGPACGSAQPSESSVGVNSNEPNRDGASRPIARIVTR